MEELHVLRQLLQSNGDIYNQYSGLHNQNQLVSRIQSDYFLNVTASEDCTSQYEQNTKRFLTLLFAVLVKSVQSLRTFVLLTHSGGSHLLWCGRR